MSVTEGVILAVILVILIALTYLGIRIREQQKTDRYDFTSHLQTDDSHRRFVDTRLDRLEHGGTPADPGRCTERIRLGAEVYQCDEIGFHFEHRAALPASAGNAKAVYWSVRTVA